MMRMTRRRLLLALFAVAGIYCADAYESRMPDIKTQAVDDHHSNMPAPVLIQVAARGRDGHR